MNKIKLAYIIDDDDIIVYLTERILKEIDFCEKNENFKNGQLAIDNLKKCIEGKKELPQVILFDINMPIMDGWEFLQEYKKLPLKNSIPLFVFTSSINPSDKEKALKYKEIKDYIQKPLTVHKLNKILRLIK